jgi:hypothetical protein
MSSAGGHPSRQKMVSVGTSIVPPGPRPSPADTPGLSTAATAPQVTASLHDFAVSLGDRPPDFGRKSWNKLGHNDGENAGLAHKVLRSVRM